MLNSADVKDKSIRMEGFRYRATVAYYTGSVVNCGLFESLHGAQIELRKYPPDIWDGYDVTHARYRGLDHEFKKSFQKANRGRVIPKVSSDLI